MSENEINVTVAVRRLDSSDHPLFSFEFNIYIFHLLFT